MIRKKNEPLPLTIRGYKFNAQRLSSGAYRIFAPGGEQLGYVLATSKVGKDIFYGHHLSRFEGEPAPDVYRGGAGRLAEAVEALIIEDDDALRQAWDEA